LDEEDEEEEEKDRLTTREREFRASSIEHKRTSTAP
tara:strand:- start:50 stop:157 length:108 start_codon:yes stop_codon:yes gene_type:complete